MAKMEEKRNQKLSQNIQMINTERRIDKPQISIVTRSGVTTSSDKVDGKKESELHGSKILLRKFLFFYI